MKFKVILAWGILAGFGGLLIGGPIGAGFMILVHIVIVLIAWAVEVAWGEISGDNKDKDK